MEDEYLKKLQSMKAKVSEPESESEEEVSEEDDFTRALETLKPKETSPKPVVDDVKKKDTPSAASLFEYQLQDVDLDKVQADLYDEYYQTQLGVEGPVKSSQVYEAAKERGLDNFEAAREAGIPVIEEEGPEGISQRVVAPSEWMDKQDDAKAYVAKNAKSVVSARIDSNINELLGVISNQKKVKFKSDALHENLTKARRELGKQILMRRKYGLVETDEDIHREVFDIKATTVGDHFGNDLDEDKTFREGGFLIDGAVPKMSTSEFESLISKDRGEDDFVPLDVVPGKEKELKGIHNERILFREASSLLGEAMALKAKADDPDGFAPSMLKGFANHFIEMGETVRDVSELVGFTEAPKQARKDRTNRKGALEAAYDKFGKVGSGELEVEDLSDGELSLYLAVLSAGESMAISSDEIPFTTNLGESVGHAMGFIVEIAATGGSSAAIRSTAKKVVLARVAGLKAPSLAAHFAANATAVITNATIQTAKMPSFYKASTARYVDGENMGSALLNGYFDTYPDILASNVFTMPMNAASTGLSKGAQTFWGRANTVFGAEKGVGGLLRANLKEYTEEQLAQILHASNGATSLRDFHNRMPNLKQQMTILGTTSLLSSFGTAQNAANRLKVQYEYVRDGRTLGTMKGDIDMMMTQSADGFAVLNEVVDAIDQFTVEPKRRGEMYGAAVRYMTNAKTIKMWDANRVTVDTRTLEDGDFSDGTSTGEVLSKGEAFVLKYDEATDKETLTFSRKLSDILGRFSVAEKVSIAEMEYAAKHLTTMEALVTNAESKAIIKSMIESLTDITGDAVPMSELMGEVNKIPKFFNTKAELPVKPGENLVQNNSVDMEGRRVGYTQEVTVDGATKHYLFSSSKRFIGTFDSTQALNDGIRKHAVGVTARRVTKDIVNEGSPKEYIKDLRKKMNEAALDSKASHSLRALEAKSEVADALNSFVKKGKISSEQAVAIAKDMGKVDLSRPIERSNFLAYAEAVINDGNNVLNIGNRKARRKSVLRAAKQKKTSPDVKKLGKEFGKINPVKVDNHDAYMEVADSFMAGTRSSTTDKGTGELKQRKTMNTAEAQKYIETELQRQADADAALQKQINKELTGDENVSLESIRELTDKTVQEQLQEAGIPEGQTKENVKQWIENAKPRIKSILKGNETTESGEPLDITEHGKRMVDRFMKLDVDKLSDAQALRVLDGLDSFIKNGTVFGMENAVMMEQGAVGAANLIKAGAIGKTFWTIYQFKGLNRFLGEKFASLPVFMENVFRGKDNAAMVMSASGFRDIMVGNSKALGEAQMMSVEYHKKFGKQKVNGEDFMSERNIAERGLWAEVVRDSESENAQENFEKSKNQIMESREALKRGTEAQQKLGDIYETLYNEYLKDSESVADVAAKMAERSSVNMDAVSWWTNRFEQIAPNLKTLLEGVYDKTMSLESHYTPRTMRKVDSTIESTAEVLEELKGSMFNTRTGSLSPKQATVTMDKRDYTKVPVNKYLDLNFDGNMDNAMQGALLDLYTSPHVVRLASFLNSPDFEALFGDKETAEVFKTRAISYVNDISGRKSVKTSKYVKELMPWVQQYAATRALGRATMSAQQMIPVALNTFINSGTLDLSAMYGKDANAINNFIDHSGYGIALRGAQSRGDLPTAKEFNKGSNIFTRASKKTSDFYLNTFLIDRDRRIARASWITYYKLHLNQLGVDVGKIDWSTHKIDNVKARKAADYAEHMVNRQQNVSDASLMGEFLKSKSDSDKFIRSTLFVFANFVMNQKMRMHTDFAILADRNTSVEDKWVAARSVGGVVAEQAAFHSLGSIFRFYMQSLANQVLGVEESEEEREERWRKMSMKTLQYFAVDLLSPAPVMDKLTVAAGRNLEYLFENFNKEEKEEYIFNNYGGDDILDAFGVISMVGDDVSSIISMTNKALSGKYRKTFAGNVTTKYLTESEMELMKVAATARLLHSLGVLPTDFKQWADYTERAIDRQAETKAGMEKRQKRHNELMKQIKSGGGSSSSTGAGKYSTSYDGKR